MKFAKIDDTKYFLRLEKDEEVSETLKIFCGREQITSGYIQGIGGLQTAMIGVYRLAGKKQYEYQTFEGDLELVSLQGNISLDESGHLMIHMHAVVGNEKLETVGGHFDQGTVGGTVELMVTAFKPNFTRVLDEEIGLKLIRFDD